MTIRFASRSVLLSVVLALSTGLAGPRPVRAAEPMLRPGFAAACHAWFEHVGALIDEHRVAHEMDDDALWGAIDQFGSARAACAVGEFETGLHIYETIALGRVKSRLR